MPYRKYKKRYTRKRRGNKTWLSSAQSAWKLAKSAYNQIRYLKSLINVEKKKYDVEVTATTVSSSGAVYSLSGIAQGDTDQLRNGNSILCQNLYLRGVVAQPNNLTGMFRLIIFLDKQQVSDTSPSLTDVIDPTFSNYYNAPLNNLTVGRFKILKDTKFHTEPGSAITIPFKYFIPLTGHHMRFNGTASTDIQKGGIYILVVSDKGALFPTIEYVSRLTFTDN